MQRSLISGHNNQRHLSNDEVEHNVGGLPVTDNRIRELFDSLDEDQSGLVSLEAAKNFYLGIEHFGLIPTEAEAERKVRKFISTNPDALTFDEFCLFYFRNCEMVLGAFLMNHYDILTNVFSYCPTRDLVELSKVSPLFRLVTELFLSPLNRAHYTQKCYQNLVELAPPSQILAISFLSRNLSDVVCLVARNFSDSKCWFYKKNIVDGTSSSVEMPDCYGSETSLVSFESGRFLVCTKKEGDILLFDCYLEAFLEVPFGLEKFYASPDGSHFLLDYDRHLYYCDSQVNISHIECHVKVSKSIFNVRDEVSRKAKVSVDHSRFSYYLGNSSPAWRTCWVGNTSVLLATEEGVSVLKSLEGTFSAVPVSVPTSTSNLCHCSRWDVFGFGEGDMYVIFDCKTMQLFYIDSDPKNSTMVRTLLMKDILPVRTVVKSVFSAAPDMFFLHVQLNQIDYIFLSSLDLTVTRWITIGEASLAATSSDTVIAVSVPKTQAGHPLLEEVEGGLGRMFTFTPHQSVSSTISELSEYTYVSSKNPEDGGSSKDVQLFDGVAVLSWIAFGVMSASLLWTISALCLNGWWFHFQLLFWGKVR